MEVKIDQMPFGNIIEYVGFQGQKHMVKYDMLTIVEGDCNHGNATISFSETVQTTTRSINSGAICFQYKSGSDSYTDNRLQFRVRLTVKELKCRKDQLHVNSNMRCRTVCFPDNRTREDCQMPTTTFNTHQLSTTTKRQQTGKMYYFNSTYRPATTSRTSTKMTKSTETLTQQPMTTNVNNFSQKHTTNVILTTSYRNKVQSSSRAPIGSTTHTNIIVSDGRTSSMMPSLPPDLSKNRSCTNLYTSSMTRKGKISYCIHQCRTMDLEILVFLKPAKLFFHTFFTENK
ncbi:uncharacterized protein LOC127726976 [Mytilus californianus]|uniref:uncharacterized protein LOC127726976 n=1 Tax=Mytilus californianus TaxID=6549 RepID=UPI002245A4E7|nr:uncharacterized protein LOC127726976 [Mytilus californianus]